MLAHLILLVGPLLAAHPLSYSSVAGPGPPQEAEPWEEPVSVEGWIDEVDVLIAQTRADTLEPDEVDARYDLFVGFLRDELARHQGVFRRAKAVTDKVADVKSKERPDDRTIKQLHADLARLAEARLRLLRVVSADKHARVTGLGVEGIQELKTELTYVSRHMRYQRVAIPDELERLLREIRAAPLPVIGGIFTLGLILILFRAWRRWAAKGIQELRDLIRATWHGDRRGWRFSEFLRYVDQVRHPLEWLILLYLLIPFVDEVRVPEPAGSLYIAATWVLLGWFAVALVDAFAMRPRPWGALARSKLRLKTLGIVAAWLVFLGLGLHLARHFAGIGTIHAWVWVLFEVLAFPVGLLLLLVWRKEIKKRLEYESRFASHARRVFERKRFGLLETVVGMAVLSASFVRRLGLRLVRKSTLGRTLVAEAVRQRMVKASEGDTELLEGAESNAELMRRFVEGESLLATAIQDELGKVQDRMRRGWPFVGVIAERGGGKSVFLRHLVEQHEGPSILVGPEARADEIKRAIAMSVGLGESAQVEEVEVALESAGGKVLLAWDDMHRLSQPVLGGQRGLDELSGELAEWQNLATTVGAIDSAGWQYLSRVREGRIAGASQVMLSAWTEGELGELVDQRARELGIELSYRRLSFPRFLMERDFASEEEGVRASFHRILWREADGNPSIALRLVGESLIPQPDGTYAVQLPSSPSLNEFDGVNLVTLFVLRALLQYDGATHAQIVDGLRYPPGIVRNALHTTLMRGWVEEVDDHVYHVAWKWYRTVARALARRNLLSAAHYSTEEDEQRPVRQMPGWWSAQARGSPR